MSACATMSKAPSEAPVLARLRPRHEQVLGHAGRRAIRRRRGHGRGVLPRGHQLRVLGGRQKHSIPRLLLLHCARTPGAPEHAPPACESLVGGASERLARDPSATTTSAALTTPSRRCSTSFRAPTKRGHPSRVGISPTPPRGGARSRSIGSPTFRDRPRPPLATRCQEGNHQHEHRHHRQRKHWQRPHHCTRIRRTPSGIDHRQRFFDDIAELVTPATGSTR